MRQAAVRGLPALTDGGHARTRLQAFGILRVFALLVMASFPGLSLAVSLGEISVDSYLNQPFRAEIPVKALRSGESAQLRATLAGDAAFRRHNLEKDQFLSQLVFTLVDDEGPDKVKIRITSELVAKEPFFSFLVELKGQRESLIREYTVLLDPVPVTTPAPLVAQESVSAPVIAAVTPAPMTQKPAVLTPRPKPAPAPRPTPTAAPENAPVIAPAIQPRAPLVAEPAPILRSQKPAAPVKGSAERLVSVPQPEMFSGNEPVVMPSAQTPSGLSTAPVISNGRYGPVRAGEALWGIAAAVRPSSKVTMNQVMWALYSSNPDQFEGSIHQVRKGAILRVPSEQAMRNVSPAEAAALIADDVAGLRSSQPQVISLETVKPANPGRESSRAPQAEAAKPVATPQVASLPVAEKPALAVRPGAAKPAAPAVIEPPAGKPRVVKPTPGGVQREMDDEGYAELPALPDDEEVDSAPSQPKAAAPKAPVTASTPETGTSGLPIGGILGGLIALILAGIGVVLVRKKRRKDAKPTSDHTGSGGTAAGAVAGAAAGAVAASAYADDTAGLDVAEELSDTVDLEATAEPELDLDVDDDWVATAQFEAPLQEQDTASLTSELEEGVGSPPAADQEETALELDFPEDPEATPVESPALDENDDLDLGSETVSLELNEDPLSEADFQLAYGLYDEAAQLLGRAIEADPERIDLYEKLGETYFAASEADSFRHNAERLKALGPGDDVWQRMSIMGQQLCPDDPLFGAGGDGATVDLDMDFAEPAEDAGVGEVIEFEIGEEAAVPSPEKTPSSQDNDLDFEADFSDFELPETAGPETGAVDDLPELDFDDLESELEGTAQAAVRDDKALDDALGDSFELDDLGLEDVPAEEAGTDLEFGDAEPPKADGAEQADDLADDLSFEMPGLETSDEDAGGLSLLDDAPEEGHVEPATEFDLGDLEDDGGLELDLGDGGDAAATDFDLDALDQPASAQATDFDLDSLDKGGDGAYDLDDLDSAGETDFDLDALETSAESDFELDDDAQAHSVEFEETELSDLDTSSAALEADDNSLEFSLDDDAGLDDLDLSGLDDSPGSATDFDLGEDDFSSAGAAELAANPGTEDIAGGDEAATKLDLARAYVDMGEVDMARNLLQEVLSAGSAAQQEEAQGMLESL